MTVLGFMGGTLYEYWVINGFETDPISYDAGYTEGYDRGYADGANDHPFIVKACSGEGFYLCALTAIAIPLLALGFGFVLGYVMQRSDKKGGAHQ